jgi:hypothetical protein
VVSVCLHIDLDGTAAAAHEVAWCRSNPESVQNQRSERHRSLHGVLPGFVPKWRAIQNKTTNSYTIEIARDFA